MFFQLEKRDPDGSCSVVRVKNIALDLKGVAYSTTQSSLPRSRSRAVSKSDTSILAQLAERISVVVAPSLGGTVLVCQRRMC